MYMLEAWFVAEVPTNPDWSATGLLKRCSYPRGMATQPERQRHWWEEVAVAALEALPRSTWVIGFRAERHGWKETEPVDGGGQ